MVFPELTATITARLRGHVPAPYTVRVDALHSRVEEMGWVGLVVTYPYRGQEYRALAKGHREAWQDPECFEQTMAAIEQSIVRSMHRADREAGEP